MGEKVWRANNIEKPCAGRNTAAWPRSAPSFRTRFRMTGRGSPSFGLYFSDGKVNEGDSQLGVEYLVVSPDDVGQVAQDQAEHHSDHSVPSCLLTLDRPPVLIVQLSKKYSGG